MTGNSTERVLKTLKATKGSNYTLLAVSINSPGGNVSQAKILAKSFKRYSEANSLPYITFAEDLVLNSANIILSSAPKSYASNSSSLINR